MPLHRKSRLKADLAHIFRADCVNSSSPCQVFYRCSANVGCAENWFEKESVIFRPAQYTVCFRRYIPLSKFLNTKTPSCSLGQKVGLCYHQCLSLGLLPRITFVFVCLMLTLIRRLSEDNPRLWCLVNAETLSNGEGGGFHDMLFY
eukprot:GILK01013600.1.p1 GENE.GILK01013600.1~~GILK01013600.1.p1  ORF type:complete len:146 (+),score=1.98 GILK01013600.1:131-568(+)